jgi:ABC-type molybdate transport system substrate-binding protein
MRRLIAVLSIALGICCANGAGVAATTSGGGESVKVLAAGSMTDALGADRHRHVDAESGSRR